MKKARVKYWKDSMTIILKNCALVEKKKKNNQKETHQYVKYLVFKL